MPVHDCHQIEEPATHPLPGRRFAKQICREGADR
jgi:hypothetical protein